MEKITYIQLQEFCTYNHIEVSFVQQLEAYEIIRIEIADDEMMISQDELSKLEKMVRLHHDLKINPEGLQAIDHLLAKIDELQSELLSVRRTLNRLEE